MKFEEAIKMVGKQYIQEEIKCREENDITIKLPIRFKIRMWWMFKKKNLNHIIYNFLWIIAICNGPFFLVKYIDKTIKL